MSRYIDADKLKENFIGVYEDEINFSFDGYAIKCIDEAPSIEIVRCKECKYIYTMNCAFYEAGDNVKPDDFCSYGKVSEIPTGSEKPNNSTISKMEQVGKE